MEPVQYGYLFPLAMLFVFVILPVCLWQGFHWMHELDETDHDHGNQGH